MKVNRRLIGQKNIILTFCLFGLFSTAQGKGQSHPVSFETSDGIYGSVYLKTKPHTMGNGYVIVDAQNMTIKGVKGQASNPPGYSFPMNVSKFTLNVSGIGCMYLTSSQPYCGNFTIDYLSSATSDYTEVGFSEEVKKQHNDLRKSAGGEGKWQISGFVRNLSISNIRTDSFRDILKAIAEAEVKQKSVANPSNNHTGTKTASSGDSSSSAGNYNDNSRNNQSSSERHHTQNNRKVVNNDQNALERARQYTNSLKERNETIQNRFSEMLELASGGSYKSSSSSSGIVRSVDHSWKEREAEKSRIRQQNREGKFSELNKDLENIDNLISSNLNSSNVSFLNELLEEIPYDENELLYFMEVKYYSTGDYSGDFSNSMFVYGTEQLVVHGYRKMILQAYLARMGLENIKFENAGYNTENGRSVLVGSRNKADIEKFKNSLLSGSRSYVSFIDDGSSLSLSLEKVLGEIYSPTLYNTNLNLYQDLEDFMLNTYANLYKQSQNDSQYLEKRKALRNIITNLFHKEGDMENRISMVEESIDAGKQPEDLFDLYLYDSQANIISDKKGNLLNPPENGEIKTYLNEGDLLYILKYADGRQVKRINAFPDRHYFQVLEEPAPNQKIYSSYKGFPEKKLVKKYFYLNDNKVFYTYKPKASELSAASFYKKDDRTGSMYGDIYPTGQYSNGLFKRVESRNNNGKLEYVEIDEEGNITASNISN